MLEFLNSDAKHHHVSSASLIGTGCMRMDAVDDAGGPSNDKSVDKDEGKDSELPAEKKRKVG